MEYIHNTEQFQFHNTVVALGKFDGMHKGHQLIFDELIQYKQLGYQAAVFSFDRPPLNMLKTQTYESDLHDQRKDKNFLQEEELIFISNIHLQMNSRIYHQKIL